MTHTDECDYLFKMALFWDLAIGKHHCCHASHATIEPREHEYRWCGVSHVKHLGGCQDHQGSDQRHCPPGALAITFTYYPGVVGALLVYNTAKHMTHKMWSTG